MVKAFGRNPTRKPAKPAKKGRQRDPEGAAKARIWVLPNRDTTTATPIAHYLALRLHLPYLACSSHCPN